MKRTTEPRPVTILHQLPVRLVLDVVEMRESFLSDLCLPKAWLGIPFSRMRKGFSAEYLGWLRDFFLGHMRVTFCALPGGAATTEGIQAYHEQLLELDDGFGVVMTPEARKPLSW